MENEKKLIEELDLYYYSKTLFLSNYKLLKKLKRDCERRINNIKRKDLGELSDLDVTNYKCLRSVLSILNVSLSSSRKILENGVTDENLQHFYRTLYHLYVREGNEF